MMFDLPQEFYGADPKCSPDYGRIINQRHFNRIMGLMEGYTPVVGGQSDASQRYIGRKMHFQIPQKFCKSGSYLCLMTLMSHTQPPQC